MFLQERTTLTVAEVEDKMPIEGGTIFIAPADYHLLVDRGFFALSTDPPVRYSRPSIDVTFYSVADSYGASSIGVVLTGANADGSRGLRRIFDRGGLTFVQDPLTAESPTMPSAAMRCVPEAKVLPIPQIAEHLVALAADQESPARREPLVRPNDARPHRASPGGA